MRTVIASHASSSSTWSRQSQSCQPVYSVSNTLTSVNTSQHTNRNEEPSSDNYPEHQRTVVDAGKPPSPHHHFLVVVLLRIRPDQILQDINHHNTSASEHTGSREFSNVQTNT